MPCRKRKKREQCYKKKIWKFKKHIEVEKTFSLNYGAPGESRRKKRKRTPEDIDRINEWQAEKTLRRKINANFGEDDWHLIPTFTKDKRPASLQEARTIIKKFLRDMRKEYKMLGMQFKYICAFEIGSRGAPHFHTIINNIQVGDMSTTKIVRKLWKYGRPKFIAMDDTGDYKDLAEYIIKQTKHTFREEEAVFRARYTCSKNLIEIEPEEEELGRYWSKNTRKIEVPPDMQEQGWYVDKSSIYEGINPVTGRHYQYYTLRLDEAVHKRWKKQQRRINTEWEGCG